MLKKSDVFMMRRQIASVWMMALEEHLNEYTYDASEADLEWSILFFGINAQLRNYLQRTFSLFKSSLSLTKLNHGQLTQDIAIQVINRCVWQRV